MQAEIAAPSIRRVVYRELADVIRAPAQSLPAAATAGSSATVGAIGSLMPRGRAAWESSLCSDSMDGRVPAPHRLVVGFRALRPCRPWQL